MQHSRARSWKRPTCRLPHPDVVRVVAPALLAWSGRGASPIDSGGPLRATRTRSARALALLLGAALIAAACGSDDDGGEGANPDADVSDEQAVGGTITIGAE